MWNYAQLSKAAKNAGGPDKLADSIYLNGVDQGRKSMGPWLIVAGGLGAFAYNRAIKINNYFKERRKQTNYGLEKVKQELIDGINEYDKNNEKEEENKE